MSSNQNSPDAPTKVVRFDRGYVRTMPGILKLAQIACNLLGFLCIKISTSLTSSVFYNLVYWVANIITILLFLMYLFHFVEKFDKLPWVKYEFFYCSIVTLTYVGCSIFAATIGDSPGYAVTFLGVCAIIAYGFEAYLKWKAWKRGLPPQRPPWRSGLGDRLKIGRLRVRFPPRAV